MAAKTYHFAQSAGRLIEKIVDDDNLVINHMILPQGESLPVHYSNSNVYMIVVQGNLTLSLNDQEPQQYAAGSIINIPYKTKMNATNCQEERLEFFVVKAPNPKDYSKQS
ncbi:MAG: cupin domain-containing protein [bacterium]|jgi:quercetin dioxygenase-like cupin family protein